MAGSQTPARDVNVGGKIVHIPAQPKSSSSSSGSSNSNVTYYKEASGAVTYRAGGAAPPAGSVQISQAEYNAPQQAASTPRPTEYLVRTAEQGQTPGYWQTRTAISPNDLASRGYTVPSSALQKQQQSQSSNQALQYGAIPTQPDKKSNAIQSDPFRSQIENQSYASKQSSQSSVTAPAIGDVFTNQLQRESFPSQPKQLPDANVYGGASDDLRRATARQQNPAFKLWESVKSGLQLASPERDTFSSQQQLEIAFTGRNPITGQIESKTEARSRIVGSTLGNIFTVSAGTPIISKSLQTINYIGNTVRSMHVVDAISSIGKAGRIATTSVTYGAEAYATFKVGEKTINALAPYETKQKSGLTGITDKQFTYIYSQSRGKNGVSIEKQAYELGLSSMQSNLITQRAALRERGTNVLLAVNLLQAEAFANIAGGGEIAIAKTAGKVGTKSADFAAKIIPGWIEGSVGRASIYWTSYSTTSMYPSLKTEALLPAYDSLKDKSVPTKQISISREEFNKLGIKEGQPIPEGIIPKNTNLMYSIVEKPSVSIEQDMAGNTITTTSNRISELSLSTSREAQKPKWDILSGRFPYGGDQKKISLGKTGTIAAFGAFGVLTAGTFGVVEGIAARSSSKTAKVAVQGLGYGLDPMEAPGDLVTPISTIDSKPIYTPAGSSRTFTSAFNPSYSNTQSESPGFKTKASTKTYSNVFDVSSSKNDVMRVKTNINVPSFTNVGRQQPRSLVMSNMNNRNVAEANTFANTNSNVQDNVNSFVSTFSDVNVNTNNYVPAEVPSNSISNTFSNVFNSANTMSNVNTDVNTNVNTNVFTPRIPLGFPLFGGDNGAGKGRGRRKQKYAYIGDFMAHVLNQWTKTKPMKGLYTGQERRLLYKKRIKR